jgi:hypothetical protein
MAARDSGSIRTSLRSYSFCHGCLKSHHHGINFCRGEPEIAFANSESFRAFRGPLKKVGLLSPLCQCNTKAASAF